MPTLDLSTLGSPVPVPSLSFSVPSLTAVLHTGADALACVQQYCATTPGPIAVDIEAAGLGAKAFTVKCVTLAFSLPTDSDTYATQAVLLDPRDNQQAACVRQALEHACQAGQPLRMHNAAYDWPVLVNYGLAAASMATCVYDTIVTARMAYPDRTISKSLEALATRPELLDMPASDVSMAAAFKAAGYRTQAQGWAEMDIDSPVYRIGAMADTVVTLRLADAVHKAAVDWLTGNPFTDVSVDTAQGLISREQTTNQTMLAVSARGLKVDTEYLDTYQQQHSADYDNAASVLVDAGLDPAAGNLGAKVVEYLSQRGQLPADWPVTATGKAKADKKAMARLGSHPLAQAQQKVASLSKVTGYLTKVSAYAAVTGRVHPQVAILGASATGRMAYSEPELQQFPADARGILVPDTTSGWVSIDWSSIEPVVVANCAGDRDFLAPFNNDGADLYAPIVANAGVDRKTAKVVLLAAMYGQGRALLASNLGVDENTAVEIQSRVFESMPATKKFLDVLRVTGDSYGETMTADMRRLPVPVDPAGRVMGYKATNYFTQGTAYSVLSQAINTLQSKGLADAIYLAMHDELVVDAAAAGEVKQVMEQAPEWLESFAGHSVVLRTDSNPLPGRWAYV